MRCRIDVGELADEDRAVAAMGAVEQIGAERAHLPPLLRP